MVAEMGSEMGADMGRDMGRDVEDTTRQEGATQEGSYFLLGAILGAAVGTAIALLFTPKPGEEMRGTIKEKGIELRRRAEDDVPTRAEVAETAESAMQSARDELRSVGDDIADSDYTV